MNHVTYIGHLALFGGVREVLKLEVWLFLRRLLSYYQDYKIWLIFRLGLLSGMFFVLFAVLVIAGEKKETDGLLLLESIDAQSIFTRFFLNELKTLWWLVCYTAVFSVVTQCFFLRTLRDDTKNGCVADYLMAGISLIQSDVDLSWSRIKRKSTLEVRGFEPRTFRMRSGRSTTEPHPRRVA